MFRKKQLPPQQTLWIPTDQIAIPRTMGFYDRVNQVLENCRFAENVRDLCSPYYSPDANGAPGIDPVVYVKMLMIGFFENLPSERAIASRCEDSISIRTFLGYALTERTPEHSWLTVMRKRLPEEVFRAVFVLMLGALKSNKLVKGRHLGIDSTVIEANASLKSLKNKMTEEDYWTYVKRLAAAEGIDVTDGAAVRRFDKKRSGKKTSNKEWNNPHDPDARIGKTKDGATDMIYKAEHTVDMETGAIVDVHTLLGDQGDTQELAERVKEAHETIDESQECAGEEIPTQTITMDKGYYSVEENGNLQKAGIKTVVSDPIENRRMERLKPEEIKVVLSAIRSSKSKYGKHLLRRRGMHNERSFAHVMDQGGFRRMTIRGRGNIQKKHYILASVFNLSLLLRKLLGIGTPRQWIAEGEDVKFDSIERFASINDGYFCCLVDRILYAIAGTCGWYLCCGIE